MQPEDLKLDSYAMFKAEDGYINVTMSDIPLVTKTVTAAMEASGHSVYGANRTGSNGLVTLTFVTNEQAALLKEMLHASCRNSLAGIIPEPLRVIQASIGSPGTERDVGAINPDDSVHARPDCFVDKSGIIPEVYFRTITVPYEPKDKPE